LGKEDKNKLPYHGVLARLGGSEGREGEEFSGEVLEEYILDSSSAARGESSFKEAEEDREVSEGEGKSNDRERILLLVIWGGKIIGKPRNWGRRERKGGRKGRSTATKHRSGSSRDQVKGTGGRVLKI